MILLTGATRGIGKFLFEKFISLGEDVIGTYHNTFPENDIDRFIKIDLADYDSLKNMINKIQYKLKNVVLINCAGNNYNSFAHKSNIEKWEEVININLIGTFRLINLLLPIMREQNYGRIINFASIVAQKGVPGTSAYAASKSGLWGLTKAIAVENANKGITINNLNLGYFNIGMITEVPENFLKQVINSIPKAELGNPDNIFNVVKFLIESDYITGTSIDINGGLF
ncbi:MAG: SDR family NAD(P)-dependent oxidoreductase [Candidatus Kapabacteria bacterium]|nr:SDR family NAD(P)-dependent oxidoreductase [Candidatus Kapabacteria bacterium]